jgi:hypothetical protein
MTRSPTTDEAERIYRGPCAGGPIHGKPLGADHLLVSVPVIMKGAPGFGCSWYLWNDDIKMWIWQG